MKQIVVNQSVKIPEGLTCSVKSRTVTLKGPRGILKRSFKHLALDISMVTPRLLRVEKWFGTKKELAAVRTVCSHIENMIKGVTKVSKNVIHFTLSHAGFSKNHINIIVIFC
jgi:large subunit ribosomal protein L9e